MEAQGELVGDAATVGDVAVFAPEDVVAGIRVARQDKSPGGAQHGFEVAPAGRKRTPRRLCKVSSIEISYVSLGDRFAAI